MRLAGNTADAGKLIDALNSANQTASPTVDVGLGATQDVTVQPGTPFTASIYVDGTLDELEVTVSHDGPPTGAQLTLLDPNGNAVSPSSTYTDGADTLYAFNILSPTAGDWELEVKAVGSPIVATYAATGYANEGATVQAILTTEGGSIVSYPEEVVLVASLSGEQAIARATVSAWVEKPDGTFADIAFKDDGVAPDIKTDDGLYTALMPYAAPGDHRITAVFDNDAGGAVYTQEGEADGGNVFKPVTSNFERTAELQVLVQDYASDDHGSTAAAASDVLPNNSDTAGRIDKAGDGDVFRITSSVPDTSNPKSLVAAKTQRTQAAATTRYALRLTHFAFGMNAVMKVTTRTGTKTYETGVLGFNTYWSLPVDLGPGEVVLVEVLHKNAQATAGSYDISFGKPLLGEFAGRFSYLPLVSR